MGSVFLILRFFYHILPKKNSSDNLISAIKDDFVNLYAYAQQIVLSNPKKIKSRNCNYCGAFNFAADTVAGQNL